MRSSFLIPIIAWLPPAYRCTIVLPAPALGWALADGSGGVLRYWRVLHEGEVVAEGEDEIRYRDGRPVSRWPGEISWDSRTCDWGPHGGMLEFGVRSADDTPIFRRKALPNFYNVFDGAGRKPFFTCQTWKFGSPQVISQIAKYGKYVDAYPVIHIDRARDLGDSLVLTNPYQKPVLARLLSHDGRSIPRIRLPKLSVRRVPLDQLLQPDEESWFGQVQLTANNRIATNIVKHSLADPDIISTVEHLDPFRADPTHFPWFKWLRNTLGRRLTQWA